MDQTTLSPSTREQSQDAIHSGDTSSQASSFRSTRTSASSPSTADSTRSLSPSPTAVSKRRNRLKNLSSAPRMSYKRHEGSPLATLKGRRPPSTSTVTALSESVSYDSTSDRDEDERSHLPLHDEDQEASSMGLPDGLEWLQNDPRPTVLDLEMGVASNDHSSTNSGKDTASARPPIHQQRFYPVGAASSSPSVASSISSSSFRSRRNRIPVTDASVQNSIISNDDRVGDNQSTKKSSPSLRASLDAGMAAVRTWVRSRGTANTNSSSNNSQHSDQPTEVLGNRARSVTWQPRASSTAASIASTSQNMEELDDLLQLDDLSISSSRADDDSRSVSSQRSVNSLGTPRYRPASAPTVPGPYRHRQSHQPRAWPAQPDTMLEAIAEGDGGGSTSPFRLFSRQRSQSEPDGRKIPDFFLGPAPSTRYNAASVHGGTRQRRRLHTSERRRQSRGVNYHQLRQQRQSQQSENLSSFTRRLPMPRRPLGENDSQQLSTSAAAALYENPHQSSQSVSSVVHSEYSDAGASVGTATTATAPLESAFEMVSMSQETRRTLAASPQMSQADGLPRDRSTINNANPQALVPVESSSSNNAPSASPASPTIITATAGGIRNTQAQVTETERQARIRWIRINRRFQIVLTIVALIFSLLLFSILICWVWLTSSFVLALDKECDVPLQRYFWLVTLQLVLDVFRSDIMRIVFRWDSNANPRIPARVIAYNCGYLVYAIMVLRLGTRSVFIDDTTCNRTAPELYKASAAFVSLSIAAWATIVGGYVLPFCVVAAMLTCNGYNPTSQTRGQENRPLVDGATQPVFPAAYATTGAPPGTIDRLNVIRLENKDDISISECCICMEDFAEQDLLVETACKHVFHKQCCREWLRQSRTCPVCRSDIPVSFNVPPPTEPDSSSRIPLGPTGRPVVGLFRILRRTTSALSDSHASNSPSSDE